VRQRVAWVVSIPLMVGGSWAAHALDYRLIVPDAGARRTLLAATGHGYEEWLPLALAVLLAAGLVALVRALPLLRTRAASAPLWPFLLLPPLTFVLQEHAERWIATGHVPWHALLEPTFLPGVVLQLPFGVTGYVVARLTLHAARRLALVAVPRIRVVPAVAVLVTVPASDLPRRALAGSRTSRGPPHPLG
jgi:apolipoprotein N-acyltransferase